MVNGINKSTRTDLAPIVDIPKLTPKQLCEAKGGTWDEKKQVCVFAERAEIQKEVSAWDAIQFLNQQTARVNDLSGLALELLGQLYLDRPNNEFFSSKLCGDINLKAAQTQAAEIKMRREEEKKKLVPLKRGGNRGRR